MDRRTIDRVLGRLQGLGSVEGHSLQELVLSHPAAFESCAAAMSAADSEITAALPQTVVLRVYREQEQEQLAGAVRDDSIAVMVRYVQSTIAAITSAAAAAAARNRTLDSEDTSSDSDGVGGCVCGGLVGNR